MAFTGTKALFFDVFGTCVDWRATVTNGLTEAAHKALNDATKSLASSVRLNVDGTDWGKFAQDWRNTYKVFTKQLASDPSVKWKSVDDHHLDALNDLTRQYGIEGLWSPDEILELSLIWHRLDPWKDSVEGVQLLNAKFQTSTLSNGNVTLLEDLKVHSRIPFTHLMSAEMFGSYKPSPAVYLGAAERVGVAPGDCAMVAAHLNDLLAAKAAGYGTAVYVHRPREEDFSEDEVQRIRAEGSIDLWVEDANGFVTVAEELGVGS